MLYHLAQLTENFRLKNVHFFCYCSYKINQLTGVWFVLCWCLSYWAVCCMLRLCFNPFSTCIISYMTYYRTWTPPMSCDKQSAATDWAPSVGLSSCHIKTQPHHHLYTTLHMFNMCCCFCLYVLPFSSQWNTAWCLGCFQSYEMKLDCVCSH